jgi:hypothetical protein
MRENNIPGQKQVELLQILNYALFVKKLSARPLRNNRQENTNPATTT